MRDMPVSGDAGQPKQVGEPSGDLPITPVPEGDGSLERWADDYDAHSPSE